MEIKGTQSATGKMLTETKGIMNIEPDYQDSDMVIIDNVKLLVQLHPVKPELNIVAICTKGRLEAEINNVTMSIPANSLFVCPPNVTLSNVMLSPDFEYAALAITNKALQTFLRGNIDIWNRAVYMNKTSCFELNEYDTLIYRKFYDLLRTLLDKTVNEPYKRYRSNMINGIVSTALNGFCYRLREQLDLPLVEAPKQSLALFNKFLDILQHSEIKHRSVQHYAECLHISSKYLTLVCKKHSEKTAYDWIQEYTISDITYYLRQTQLSIKEISNKMGFPNSSFFGKYIKEHLRSSPMEYRRNNP